MDRLQLICVLFAACATCVVGQGAVLFSTTVTVDKTPITVDVHEGESPAQIASEFALQHKLDKNGAMDVLAHLKQKAAAQGLIKRVLYYQPFIAEIKGEKKMMNMTVYEDSDPVKLAEEAGKLYELPQTQVGQLKVALESQILQRIFLRVPIDMSASGIGKQWIIVQHGDTSATAANRFNKKLLDMGITIKQEGLQSISDDVGAQIRAKNQKNVVGDS